MIMVKQLTTYSIAFFALLLVPQTFGITIHHNMALSATGYNNCYSDSNGEKLIAEELIKSGGTVFDVGASIGEWSQLVLAKRGRVKLYAFEPIPTIFAKLEGNIKYSRAILSNIALSDAVGSRQFVFYNRDNKIAELSGFFQRPIVETNFTVNPTFITVKTDTIDHFCAENKIDHIDFLKIDTEGAELMVLRGGARMLGNKQIDIIQFEYGGTYLDSGASLKEMYQLLSQSGYSLFRIAPDGLISIPEWSDELENYQYSNYIATSPQKTTDL